MEEVAEHRQSQRFVDVMADELKVMTSEQMEVAIDVPEYLVTDTDTYGSKLYLDAYGEILPLRNFAINSLDNMLGVKGDFVGWMPAKAHAEMLNEYAIRYAPKKALSLFVEDEKVSAVVGKNSFAEIPAWDVLNAVTDYLSSEFPKANYVRGSFSHEYVEEIWRLDHYADLFRSFLPDMKLNPRFSISTSDCGSSAVTIRPSLEGDVIMPANPLRVQHRGKNGMENVKEALNKVYSLIEKGCNSLKKLSEIRIEYPDTTILRVMKANKIPKVEGIKVAAAFSENRGSVVTALDIYQAVCETLMYVPANASLEKKFRAQDDVARVAGINWAQYDLPGKFSW